MRLIFIWGHLMACDRCNLKVWALVPACLYMGAHACMTKRVIRDPSIKQVT
jgi:hypothetical protein